MVACKHFNPKTMTFKAVSCKVRKKVRPLGRVRQDTLHDKDDRSDISIKLQKQRLK